MVGQSKKPDNIAKPRPPVVAILGHVDHGKSTLLDYIRKANIVGGEAGGITQHLGAYEVLHTGKDGRKHEITFLDTPGHEAFSGIRERGTVVADVAILVVSGEDGAKPQTIEALSFITKTKTPYVVAITKMDKPTADIERTKQSLAEKEIYVEGYGGDIPFAAVSAKSGDGVDELLDLILLVAEMSDITGSPHAPIEGYVIEAEVDKKRGIGATLVIKNGTLSTGSFVVAENAFTPTRRLDNFKGESITEVLPGMPAHITGWNRLPRVGARITLVADKKSAETAIALFDEKNRDPQSSNRPSGEAQEKVIIPLIIKADTGGSLEALEQELGKLESEKIVVKIVHKGLGEISEGDIKVALGSPDALVAGFNVGVDAPTKALIERSAVLVECFDIIYKLTEWVESIAKTRTPKVLVETVKAHVKILKIFNTDNEKQIIGGKVIDGEITVGDEFRVWRRESEVGRGKIRDLQRLKVKTTTVPKDSEFGASVTTSVEIVAGDRIETITVVEE